MNKVKVFVTQHRFSLLAAVLFLGLAGAAFPVLNQRPAELPGLPQPTPLLPNCGEQMVEVSIPEDGFSSEGRLTLRVNGADGVFTLAGLRAIPPAQAAAWAGLLAKGPYQACVPENGGDTQPTAICLYSAGQMVTDLAVSEGLLAATPDDCPRNSLPVRSEVSPAAETVGPACNCSLEYQCDDFPTRDAAQDCYNACADYRFAELDPDHDGFVCENLP